MRYKAQIIQNVHDALVELQHKYSGGKELRTFTQVLYLSTTMTYLYINRVFPVSREMYFLLQYICLPALVTG